MEIKILFIPLIAAFICCKEQPKPTSISENKANNVAVILPSTSSITSTNESLAATLVNLPFDLEKYTSLCTQNSSGECVKRYPTLDESQSEELMGKLSSKLQGSPEMIFELNSPLKNGLRIYIICFDGDSSSQELVVMKGDQVTAQQSVGYAMPENKTYQSFVINEDMTIQIYDVSYNNAKKKNLEKYRILENGNISKI